jgi:GntR family transcriptional regulator, transcriptional repressor for pyruvate dehydrogenase complex
MTLDPIRAKPLADAVADRLEQLILEGVLRPGEKLAAERELAVKLDVSRPSLRDALAKLEAKGLVTTGRGGTQVAAFLRPITEPLAALFAGSPRATDDYFEYRRGIEAQAAALAARRATPQDREAIAGIISRMEAAHAAADIAAEAAADTELHIAVYEAAHNIVLLHVMRSLVDLLRRNVMYHRERLYDRPGVRAALLEQHRAIAEAVIDGDAAKAEAAASTHIRFVADTIEMLRHDEERVRQSLRRISRSDFVA